MSEPAIAFYHGMLHLADMIHSYFLHHPLGSQISIGSKGKYFLQAKFRPGCFQASPGSFGSKTLTPGSSF